MRIIAGKHRGRVLKEFNGREIRPTSDRAKEALFNILQFDIAGSEFLDLYSGTGGIGLEALSRGAERVVFVDNSRESVKLLKENLAYLKEQAEVVESDALSFVSLTKDKFDLIFFRSAVQRKRYGSSGNRDKKRTFKGRRKNNIRTFRGFRGGRFVRRKGGFEKVRNSGFRFFRSENGESRLEKVEL